MSKEFIDSFNALAIDIHENAIKKGFWEGDGCDFGTKVALIHSEVSEPLEGFRAGNPADDKIPQYSSVEAELADAVIRIIDLARRNNWRVAEAILAKNEFNKTRPYKHGKTY
jgi:hypothetical protein